MGREGGCRGNAPTGSRPSSFENGRAHGARYATHAGMEAASPEYIGLFYNRKRRHSTPGHRSPIQFPERRVRERHQEKLVA